MLRVWVLSQTLENTLIEYEDLKERTHDAYVNQAEHSQVVQCLKLAQAEISKLKNELLDARTAQMVLGMEGMAIQETCDNECRILAKCVNESVQCWNCEIGFNAKVERSTGAIRCEKCNAAQLGHMPRPA